MTKDKNSLHKTLKVLTDTLLKSRVPQGHWRGRLSSSALSTATAVFALSTVDKEKYTSLTDKGLIWLIENQNRDGGWGDTVMSASNISTTMLCWSALAIADESSHCEQAIAKAESWLADFAGGVEPAVLAKALDLQYGKDRSFSAPILTMCALAGRLGDAENAWRLIKPLPFELALCPHRLFKWLRLPVVSYALPALIAIGQANYFHRKPKNPLVKTLRHLARRKTLDVLQNIHPQNGGFLEATPLTAFVVMSLAGSSKKDNEVVRKGTQFLTDSARNDGSWPIDTDLAIWLTTLSVNALAANSDFQKVLSSQERRAICNWLLASQYHHIHPYTHAAPGGWAWTDLSGAVPDADDTAGALIALRNLGLLNDDVTQAVIAGIKWLVELQNHDGGIPTFCRGWSALPFDRSAPDITAHTVAAMGVWFDDLPAGLQKQVDKSIKNSLAYLQRIQREDGSWIPLWFGNQAAPNQENSVYGTCRVLTGLCHLPKRFSAAYLPMMQKGGKWLLSIQNQDGGWGGAESVGSTVEETALSVDALAGLLLKGIQTTAGNTKFPLHNEALQSTISQGVSWLIDNTKAGVSVNPSPIGLYFARLWYYEQLYPVIFAASALQKVKNLDIVI
ncbi:MAG: prenyltransferase/squalene oxidase repeat-containing protein [Planctomycetota bacterium]|jgi:squalene-hopene/tetraprenyl-beta-curcumene cyclase